MHHESQFLLSKIGRFAGKLVLEVFIANEKWNSDLERKDLESKKQVLGSKPKKL
jgi:hypothetical protein